MHVSTGLEINICHVFNVSASAVSSLISELRECFADLKARNHDATIKGNKGHKKDNDSLYLRLFSTNMPARWIHMCFTPS